MARGYCPSCNTVMLLGASKCHSCNWTKSNTTVTETGLSNRCELCGSEARKVKLRDAKSDRRLCYEHYVQERDREFTRMSSRNLQSYRRDVLVTDFNRNLELVKKQNPLLSEKAAIQRAQAWTQMYISSIQAMQDSSRACVDNFYSGS